MKCKRCEFGCEGIRVLRRHVYLLHPDLAKAINYQVSKDTKNLVSLRDPLLEYKRIAKEGMNGIFCGSGIFGDIRR